MDSIIQQYERQHSWRSYSDAYDLLGNLRGTRGIDVGCGSGSVMLDLHNRGCEVIGIDADEGVVEYTREKLPQECVIEVRDFDKPQYWPMKPYDFIWSSFAIAYSKNPVETLKGWRKTLKKNGKLALIEVNDLLGHRPMSHADQNAISDFYKEADKIGQYNFRAGSQIEKWVEEAGFKIEKSLQLRDSELSFRGPAEPSVILSWQNRFLRMPRLTSMTPDGFDRRFIQLLSDEAHFSLCSVNLVVAVSDDE